MSANKHLVVFISKGSCQNLTEGAAKILGGDTDFSKKCVNQYSKLFIPFLDMRIDTKQICSSIRDELGVPKAPFSFKGA